MNFLSYFLILMWILALIFIFAVGVPILIGVIDHLTGEVKIWKELKKNNTSIAIVLASIILGICWIVGLIA